MKDRRNARRYDLSFPVMVGIAKEAASRTGKTRDISTHGVYFTINSDLSTGAELNLKMTLPAEVTTGDTEVFIRATGKVVRVDNLSGHSDQKVGVAAVFDMHEIVRGNAKTT